MRRLRTIAALAVCLAGAAQAAEPIALDAICVASPGAPDGADRVVNPLLLTYVLLKGVDPLTLDRDANGGTPNEAFEALIDPNYCARDAAFPCAGGDPYKLLAARNTLVTFLTEHPGIKFEWKRAPTRKELDALPALADTFTRTADPAQRFVQMVCSPKATTAPLAAIGAAAREKRSLNADTFLLARDLAGLTAPRGKPGTPGRLKNVPQAEISYIDDNAKDTETLSVSAAAGLKIVDRIDFKLIPFVQIVRSHVEDTSGGADKDSGKLSLGALFSIMPTLDDQIDIAPLYTHDLEAGAEIIGGRIGWRPGFLYRLPSFQGAEPILCKRNTRGHCEYGSTTLAVWTDLQFVSSFGKVLDPGDDPKLTDGRNFVRAGPDARMTLYGVRGPFRDLALDVSYRHLFRLSGDGRGVSQFRAGLAYWIAGSDHVAIRYGYEKGTDEETLTRFDLWRLGLGVRF